LDLYNIFEKSEILKIIYISINLFFKNNTNLSIYLKNYMCYLYSPKKEIQLIIKYQEGVKP